MATSALACIRLGSTAHGPIGAPRFRLILRRRFQVFFMSLPKMSLSVRAFRKLRVRGAFSLENRFDLIRFLQQSFHFDPQFILTLASVIP